LTKQLDAFRAPSMQARAGLPGEQLGRVAARFASGFVNELTLVQQLAADIMTRDESRLADQKKWLEKVKVSCEYCQLLVRNLAELSPATKLVREPVDLPVLIRDVLHLLERKMPQPLEVEWQVQSEPFIVSGNSLQLKQVYLNLVRNALDAISAKIARQPSGTDFRGQLGIRIERDNPWIKSEIVDNGIGIPDEVRGKLYDLRFSTKREGFGIGLYTAKTIVERHGGTIEEDSNPGEGTAFIVRLPAAQE
jgi:signal transduction histidine kinase